MTCLYDCFYVALKEKNFSNALEVVTSPLGFSLEANIKSRSWVLCGQSDIDYYYPKLNRGYEAHWYEYSINEFQQRLAVLHETPFPLIVETDSTFVPYYPKGGLEIGMPHSFLIISWDKATNNVLVYDRLATGPDIHKDKKNLFYTQLDNLYPALEKKIFIANIQFKNELMDWHDEILLLLKHSVVNMEKKVSRSQLAYQVFGHQAILSFAETLVQFDSNYHEDVQSIWLLSNHLPKSIFQSVYGNRYLLKKALMNVNDSGMYNLIISTLNESLDAWSLLRKEFVLCANSQSNYINLSNKLLNISKKEEEVIIAIKKTLDPKNLLA